MGWGKGRRTGVGIVLVILLGPDLGLLEVLVLDFYELDHLGDVVVCVEKCGIKLGDRGVFASRDAKAQLCGCGCGGSWLRLTLVDGSRFQDSRRPPPPVQIVFFSRNRSMTALQGR
jgi:hypothetical protein